MASGKLRKGTTNKYITGVAGGMAEWLGVKSFRIRLIWVLLLLPGGIPGIFPYVLCWIIIPQKGR